MRTHPVPVRYGPDYRPGSQHSKRSRTPRRLASAAGLVVLVVLAVLVSSDLFGVEAAPDGGATGTPEALPPPDPGSAPAGVARENASMPLDLPELGTGDPTARPEKWRATAPGEPERDCSPRIPEDPGISDASPAAAGIELSQAMYDCAHEVGLAFASDPAAIATLLARGIRGPLLLVDSGLDGPLMAEIRRLAPERIVAAGFDERMLRGALADFAMEPLSVDPQATFAPSGAPHDLLWIVDDAASAVPLAALADQIGAGVVAVAGDLRAASPETRQAISAASEVEMLPGFGEDAAWQLDVVRRGRELPGGGLLLFEPDANRRLVAMYGHPDTQFLGVLGEQGPGEGVERLRAIARGYGADGSTVLPTFEIIATVASEHAGRDGNYSGETAPDVIRPWVELAAANGVYVILDLQPGRTDFLAQAKYYEEFLRLPHVGLALDPEWRLRPNEVHLRQIGTVDAAEINRVSEWLAELVREEALPQKLLILHQFRLSMITNRHLIETPPELAVLIHMDGQGSQGSKHSTWNTLTAEPDAGRYHWGWKNFYDEDSPTATPEEVLDLTPTPVFVSFQ